MTTTTIVAVNRKITKVNESWEDTQPGVKVRSVSLELECGHLRNGDRATAYSVGIEVPCVDCAAAAQAKAKAEAERRDWLNHCNKHVYRSGSFRGNWCSKPAKNIREVQIRGDFDPVTKTYPVIETVPKAYCNQHDPVRIAEKMAKEQKVEAERRDWRQKAETKAKQTAKAVTALMPETGEIEPFYQYGNDGRRYGGHYTGGVTLTEKQTERLIAKLIRLKVLEAAVNKKATPVAPVRDGRCRHENQVPFGSLDKNNRSDYCEECEAEEGGQS